MGNAFWARARLCSYALIVASGTACAADLTPRPGHAYAPPVEVTGPAYGYFAPAIDPRCRIVSMPEMSLYGFGEISRFRPTAVCQSRGLYEDTVVLP
jgi:hypothetical protein